MASVVTSARGRSVSTEILWRRPSAAGSGAGEALVAVVDPELPCRVLLRLSAATTTWQLDSLEVQRLPDGPPVGPDALRSLPIQLYLGLANSRLLATPDAPPAAPEPPAPRRRRWRRIDDEMLRTVARVYRDALAGPTTRRAPTAAVARHFGVSRGDAGRLVSRARRDGLLNPALPRRPGESTEGEETSWS